ncbi:MAG: NADH-quinone oxidoreductase subunit L [Chloroflexi bacterium RBG_13_46_14]|nr:MAG: NADH-quinone oxidoreductase subunit L [Chloroflexi bacterium RBG_13_46_14]
MPEQVVWLILLLPILSFLVISLLVKPFAKKESKLGSYIAIAAIGTSLALSLWTLVETLGAEHHELHMTPIQWLVIGNLDISIGLMVDSLTAVMVVVVTTVSLMVQIYSLGYMEHYIGINDGTYTRYYAWMSLFTASMLGVVMADSLLLIFVFWEMVGLCSYLLIGFWYHRPSAANAAKKAFIVTRLGDFGFLTGILLIFAKTGTFDIGELHALAGAGALAGTALTWAAIGIFSGAVGKSAQFPLHVWLPDAMEGPTPVSALIHSATMVSAGVFLVARTLPIFAHSTTALTTVAIIGAFTAIFAASMGLVATDIKRVLAYSTVSQLGYMMLGLGAAGLGVAHGGEPTVELAKAATAIGIFHLFTHAFFKALLFLGAGSVNHATHTFDMRLMGGLRKVMPWTYYTFLIASLSLAGIWPLAGFWSKDEILAVALENQPVLFVLALITVFMTAFYMFRVIFLTFHGEYRGGDPEAHGHPHESPMLMVLPMVVLAALAVIAGLWSTGGGFAEFMGEHHAHAPGFFGVLTHGLPWLSLLTAIAGIVLAWAMYEKKWVSAEKMGSMFKPLYTLFLRKYWMDELYQDLIVKKVLLGGLFAGMQKMDTYVIDGTVNGIAEGAQNEGKVLGKAQTGQLQVYGLGIGIGVIAIILALFIFT